jgi:phytoene dehydrogenase-like protein
MADAARDAGAEIRAGADVTRILVRTARPPASCSPTAPRSAPRPSFRARIRDTRSWRSWIRRARSGFVTRIRNYRVPGTVAKLNVALRALPAFRGVTGPAAALRGRVHIGPGIDYLERAFDASKYGDVRPRRISTSRSRRPRSVDGAGRTPRDVGARAVRALQAPRRMGRPAARARRHRDADARDVRARHRRARRAHAGDHPARSRAHVRLTAGHIHHGELALDQLFTMRPTLGWADYSHAIAGLYLCGSGTHPGNGLTGMSGANAAGGS